MIKRLRSVCLILLVLSVVISSGCAAAEKSILLTFTGDCTLGSEEATRPREDSFDSLAASKGLDYFFDNLTLSEMAETYNVTRSAVNKQINLTIEKLNEYEAKLNLYANSLKIKKLLEGIPEKTREQIEELI